MTSNLEDENQVEFKLSGEINFLLREKKKE